MGTGMVYAIAGAKGGVGKTTTSINLGAALAAAGRSAVVVELDLAMANLADFLDLDVDPEADTTLHDVLADDAAVLDAVYDAPGDFAVVPSGTSLDGFARTDVERVGDVVAALRERYDVLLLDTGAGLSHETLLPLGLASETILVSSPRVASVRDVEKTKTLTERVGGDVAGVVFVRSGTGNSPPVDRIAGFLDVPLLGHVPEDDAVPASQDAGRPVVTHASASPAAEAYRDIAASILESLDDRHEEVPIDDDRLASNVARAKAETVKHRGGFVFPDEPTGTGADADASTATDEATTHSPSESTSTADSPSTSSTQSTSSSSSATSSTSSATPSETPETSPSADSPDSESTKPDSPTEPDSSKSKSSTSSAPSQSAAAWNATSSSDSETASGRTAKRGSKGNDADGDSGDASDAGDDSDDPDSDSGLRGRVKSVVRAMNSR